jgi:hypothetical protein
MPDFTKLIRRWDSPFVARCEVDRFSGGIINPKTLANYDSLGLGPSGRFQIGRKVAYPVEEVVKWLESRVAEGGTNEVTR